MYAVFAIGDHQYKVEPESELVVFRRDADVGETIDFEEVLLVKDEEDVQIGQPVLPEASISARVEEHFRGDKITVFNYKRREGRRRKLGHRDDLTKLRIETIDY